MTLIGLQYRDVHPASIGGLSPVWGAPEEMIEAGRYEVDIRTNAHGRLPPDVVKELAADWGPFNSTETIRNAADATTAADGPVIQDVVEAAGDKLGEGVESAGNFLQTTAEIGEEIGGRTAVLGAIALSQIAEKLGINEQEAQEYDVDGNGVIDNAELTTMEEAIGQAQDEGIFDQLREALEGHAEIQACEAGLGDVALQDPAATLREAAEARDARNGAMAIA